MNQFNLPVTEAEVIYIMGLVTTDLRRMTEQSDHARSHGTRGFEATDSKVARGTFEKVLAIRDQAAYEAGVKAGTANYTPLIAAPVRDLCNGDHAAPECGDPECWFK